MRRSKGDGVLVAINLSNRPFNGSVTIARDVRFSDVTPDVAPPLPPDAPAPERAARRHPVTLPTLTLDAWGYRIFRHRN